ncbi:carboxylesterase/lipase family protein [Sphingomonas sp. PAMC 26605]|uniref:carboxylesterase/lipase family protein n=1 Tax=Sphingomonas sp. PAMC 26605 TaxID=1112214 RepID=UPI0002EAF0B3|nr:carboxylesterase family protein [Sphingomonas sp. PAMC 26605]
MRQILLVLIALLLPTIGEASSTPPADVVTRSGEVRGAVLDDGVIAFKGIPYAAAPVGPLRWRPPQPTPAWVTPLDATQFGMPCFASPLPGPAAALVQSEDCLTLNIWAPPVASTSSTTLRSTTSKQFGLKRPVMVWIHGGGFEFGSSAQPLYDGSNLARHNVVLVSFNYRLGVFGFLAHPALDHEGPASGNYGLQDQIAALRWVRANIAAFGGDPQNITIFGQSAGAHAVGMLMASPQAKGLFAKAIAESGAFWDSEHGSLATHTEAIDRGIAFQKRMGATGIAALRAIPAEQINIAGRWDVRRDPGTTAFAPSVDGYVLDDAPAAVFARGRAANVPLLAGWNAQEENPLFLPRALPHTTPQAFGEAAAKLFGRDRRAAAETAYPATDPKSSAERLIGDLVISQQTWEMLALQEKARRNGVYAYQFSFTSPYSPIANHGAEVKYVFSNLRTPLLVSGNVEADARDRATADLMVTYWTNFAGRGDPNGPGLPTWPAYRGPGSDVLAIGPAGAKSTAEAGTHRFRFIRSFRKAGRLSHRWRTILP